MTPIEKLARRICWLEFPTKQKGATEAKYWAGVHPAKKAEYIEDARWWAWMADRLWDTHSMDIQWQARLVLRRLNEERDERRRQTQKTVKQKKQIPR